VRTVVPLETFLTGEFEIRLVNQRRGLQRVAGAFLTHLSARDAAQFGMNQREELIEGRPVASAPIGEQPGYFLRRHGGHKNLPIGELSIE
jgi:hypothetical protein